MQFFPEKVRMTLQIGLIGKDGIVLASDRQANISGNNTVSTYQTTKIRRAITSAITALEALFLTDEPELTHRLSQRVCMFLRTLGSQIDSGKTYDDVSNGYKIRSKFIHGGVANRSKADILAPVLLEYARTCTLAFFQTTTPKGKLLAQLDRAMIRPASAGELENSLAAVVHR